MVAYDCSLRFGLLLPCLAVSCTQTKPNQTTNEPVAPTNQRTGHHCRTNNHGRYYAWEDRFADKIYDIRQKELSTLRKAQVMRAFNMFLINANPIALSVGTFVTYGLTEGALTASKAFAAFKDASL